jgi:hypothetical protein
MKSFLFAILVFVTMFASAQNGIINGKITDAEEGNTPLIFAEVTVKETGAKIMTDADGTFKFENIKDGTYTLVCSFSGYETQEIKTEVHNAKNTKAIALTLSASSVSLDDLTMVFATSEQKTNTLKNN